ncbi:hypothetical protein SP41_91 [Salmonella phage 41]|nr:hypothetical protein SP41_91 [Salmonella phage 41]
MSSWMVIILQWTQLTNREQKHGPYSHLALTSAKIHVEAWR